MTKNDVKTWAELEVFARERARKSAKRNDPWAWAYWRQTADWALIQGRFSRSLRPADLQYQLGECMFLAKASAERNEDVETARFYSRAKWCAILIRNQGGRIPKGSGPSLAWLRCLEGNE
jgi:hypothetical protein